MRRFFISSLAVTVSSLAVGACTSVQDALDRALPSGGDSFWNGGADQKSASRAEPGPSSSARIHEEGDERVGTATVDLSQLTREQVFAYMNRLRGDAYPLDEVKRRLDENQTKVECKPDELVVYSGSELSMLPTMIHPAFAQRMERFERAAVEAVWGPATAATKTTSISTCRRGPTPISEKKAKPRRARLPHRLFRVAPAANGDLY